MVRSIYSSAHCLHLKGFFQLDLGEAYRMKEGKKLRLLAGNGLLRAAFTVTEAGSFHSLNFCGTVGLFPPFILPALVKKSDSCEGLAEE